MMRQRHDPDTHENTDTQAEYRRGRMYYGSLLTDIEIHDHPEWIQRVAMLGEQESDACISSVLRKLEEKTRAKEPLHLPDDAHGGSTRAICKDVLKRVVDALRVDVNAARAAKDIRELGHGHIQGLPAYKECSKLFSGLSAAQSVASGNEANQRRRKELSDHEQLDLFESILGGKVAAKQRVDGVKQPRDPLDTATLGVILSMFYAMGQRCVNLDDLKFGYMEMVRFKRHQVWENVLPSFLELMSSGKMDAIGEKKQRSGILNHRDPIRSALSWLGMYFAYRFFDLQQDLPSVDTWLDPTTSPPHKHGHGRPLIVQQSGNGVHVTNYNSKLHEELALIEAKHVEFTLHGIRNGDIAEAHEDPNMRNDSILHAVGHASAHTKNYKGDLDSSMMLLRSGYLGTNPQIQAAHDRAQCEFMYERLADTKTIVDLLYLAHRKEILTKEREALEAKERERAEGNYYGPGHRVTEFYTVVRHCIFTWVVSTVARQRDRMGLIIEGSKVKRELCAPEFIAHLAPLLGTPLYNALAVTVRRYEDEEIALGPLANVGAEERRTALRVQQSEKHVIDKLDSMPEQLGARLEPRFTALTHDLQDESELGKDRDFWGQLPVQHKVSVRSFMNFKGDYTENPVGTASAGQLIRCDAYGDSIRTALRVARQPTSEIPSVGSASCGSARKPPPPPTAGLAPRDTMSVASLASLAELPTALPHASVPLPHVSSEAAKQRLPSFASITSEDVGAVVDELVSPSTGHAAPSSASSQLVIAHAALCSTHPTDSGRLQPTPADSSQIVVATAATTPPEIGSDEWKALGTEDRHRTLQALYQKTSVNGKDVPQLLRIYLHDIAHLERGYTASKRGHGWRDRRYAGEGSSDGAANAWQTRLGRYYEPVLAYVLEQMDSNQGMSLWEAADAVNRDFDLNWDNFIKTDCVSRFKDKDERNKYVKRLQDADFVSQALAALAPPPAAAEPVLAEEPEPMEEAAPATTALTVPAHEGCATRYLAIDAGLSCGFSIIQLDASETVISVDVGVLQVDKSLASDGARGLDLQQQLRPLLSPLPDHVFVEPFFGHGRQSDQISYLLRGAIAMELASHGIHNDRITEVEQQTWKVSVAGKGVCADAAKAAKAAAKDDGAGESAIRNAGSRAEKAAAKAALERQMMIAFPTTLCIGGKWLAFRFDASDAAGIGMCGVKMRHPSLAFSAALRVATPGSPHARLGHPSLPQQTGLGDSLDSPGGAGRRLESAGGSRRKRPTPATVGMSSPPTTPSRYAASMDSPRVVPDPNECTLAPGCILPVNHSGLCQCAPLSGERSSERPDYSALSGKRRRVTRTDEGAGGSGTTNPQVAALIEQEDMQVEAAAAAAGRMNRGDFGTGLQPPASDQAQPAPITSSEEVVEDSVRIPAGSIVLGPSRDAPSRYWTRYLSEADERELLHFCMYEVPFQYYQMARGRTKSDTWRYIQPKCEYWISQEGMRGVYFWREAPEFYHAGYEMPPILRAICDRLNQEFDLQGVDRLNSAMIICDDEQEHEAPLHADKHRTGRFFDLSVGYARAIELVSTDSIYAESYLCEMIAKVPHYVVANKPLESASLAYISAADNGHGPDNLDHRFKHRVPRDAEQPDDQPRFSIVFRAITAHPKGLSAGEHLHEIDPVAAARVQPGGDLWRPYIPRCRREPVPH